MVKHVACVVVGLTVCIIAAGGGAGTTDLDKVKGKWSVVALNENGTPVPAEAAKKMVVTFTDKDLTILIDAETIKLTYTLDASKTPRQIEFHDAKEKKTGLGIYALDGDTLKICVTEDEKKARPTTFTAGANITLVELKRAK